MPRIIFISGACGCGKSTLADAYAKHYVQQNHKTCYVIHGDNFYSGFVDPEGTEDLFVNGQAQDPPLWEGILRFNWDCILFIAERVLKQGLDVIIDYIIEDELPHVQKLAAKYKASLHYIVLTASAEEIVRRIRNRGDVDLIDRGLFLKQKLEAMPENQGHLYNNTERTIADEIREIDMEKYIVMNASSTQDLLPLCRTLPGVCQDQDLLTIPPEGGGLLLPDLGNAANRWINCAFILEETHAQAFEFRFYTEEEAPRVIVRFGIMPGWTARFALDLRWLDGHCLFPGHRAGTQKVVCHGSRIALSEIRRAELVAMPSADPVHVRIHALELAEAPSDPTLLPDEPMIDSFGQYIPKEWPGKIRSEEELIKALAREAAKKPVWHGSSWTVWGGDARLPLTEGSGFFGKIFRDGRWYLTDPSGCAFFSLGPDCVVVRCDARIDGLQSLLEDPADRMISPSSPLCEPMVRVFGETPRPGGLMFSYERKNLIRAFGAEWESAWRKMIVSQLMNLGLNTLGNWSDPALFGSMPYVSSLREFPATRHYIFRDFPDVLSDEYRQNALRCAQTLKDRANDPWMIGYFLRNEPAWAFVDDLIIADEVLRDPETTACKTGLVNFLSSRYETAECLSSAWNHTFASFDDLYSPLENASSLSAQAREDLREYSAFLIRQYVEIPTACCRAVDPNHMILGMRWAWISDPLLVSGWDCFDVFSINCYAVDPTPALDRVRDLGVNLPVMIGEFHFGALDAGLPATGLEAVANQAERAKAFRFYCERVAAHPFGVGCHWFQCYDQFALGRFDGENYQIGLFDITLRPYPLMEQAAHLTADRVYRVMTGEEQPFSSRPASRPMIAY